MIYSAMFTIGTATVAFATRKYLSSVKSKEAVSNVQNFLEILIQIFNITEVIRPFYQNYH